jgi:hypothetical protein
MPLGNWKTRQRAFKVEGTARVEHRHTANTDVTIENAYKRSKRRQLQLAHTTEQERSMSMSTAHREGERKRPHFTMEGGVEIQPNAGYANPAISPGIAADRQNTQLRPGS